MNNKGILILADTRQQLDNHISNHQLLMKDRGKRKLYDDIVKIKNE